MSPRLKPYYFVLACTATAGCFFVPNADWSRLSILVAACLLVIFIGRETVEDERVDYLKLKAIKFALAASVPALLFFGGIQFLAGTEKASITSPSASDMIIFMMLIALGFFRFWRWQDGRAVSQA